MEVKSKIKFILINEIPTKILLIDRNDFIDNQTKFNGKQLIIMITGNPGEIEYYSDYLEELYSQTRIPIIGLSHAGHNILDNGEYVKPKIDSKYYGLNAQIMHKVKFIENHVQSSTRIILIAHSMGCYVTLEIMDRFPHINQMIDHAILLHPTIDSFVETDYGHRINYIIKYLSYPILMILFIINLFLTVEHKEKLIRKFLQWNNHEYLPPIIRSSLVLLNADCFRSIALLVSEEFRQINEPNFKAISENSTKLSLFYAQKDKWAPLDRYHKMKDYIQNNSLETTIELLPPEIEHAFTMDKESIKKMSQITLKIIKNIWKLL